MKILVTGSNGFFGKCILRKLSLLSSVTTLSRNNSDLLFDLVNNIPNLSNFDIVIHAAGKAHSVPKNNLENDAFFDVNVKGTQNLLHGIEASGKLPKSFIFISTVAVYGLNQGNNINEKTPLLAKDPYGLSKIQAEHLVLDWCHKNNIICTILRLPLLVGENPPGNLGAMVNSIKKGYYFNIAGGTARKSMVLTEDVANILLKVTEIGGVYNLTDGYHPNFFELSIAIAKQNRKSRPFNMPYIIAKSISIFGDVVGSKFPLNSNKLKKITSDLTFDDSRAREVLGWQPSNVIDWFTK
jgi:nucleoside-diphosphate-sugar epimerase